jgi:hypothetical protein
MNQQTDRKMFMLLIKYSSLISYISKQILFKRIRQLLIQGVDFTWKEARSFPSIDYICKDIHASSKKAWNCPCLVQFMILYTLRPYMLENISNPTIYGN